MAKINITAYRTQRAEVLMDMFLKQADFAKALTCAGRNFITVHEAQILAANTIHTIEEEGLLNIAKELYPEEKECIQDYLDIYNEVSPGEKI